jgi:hypothetical protein
MAQTKFQNSGESLEKVGPESEGKDILVPLTGSVFISDLSVYLVFLIIFFIRCTFRANCMTPVM